MTENHPVTPSPELVKQWRAAASNVPATLSTDSGGRRDYIDFIATRAAQWGADAELEACCEWLGTRTVGFPAELRADRRPKPPSLKRVALLQLDVLNADLGLEGKGVDLSQIRRALEQLDD